MGDTDPLRELHETYIWEVNAAVGEDRMDLVWQLSDQYADRALQLMTAMESPGCGRPDCAICRRPLGAPSAPTRRRWRTRARWRHPA
jgi:hypothetical protein